MLSPCADDPATVRAREGENDTRQQAHANAVVDIRDGINIRLHKPRRPEAFEAQVLNDFSIGIVSFKGGLAWKLDANSQLEPMTDDDRDYHEHKLASENLAAGAHAMMESGRPIAPLRVQALRSTINGDNQGMLPDM